MAHPASRHSTDQIYSMLRTDIISGALKPREVDVGREMQQTVAQIHRALAVRVPPDFPS